MKKDALRCFIAAPLTPAVAERLEREIAFLQLAGADVAWVKRAQFHLTLRFLGDVDPGDLPDIESAIEAATQEASAARPMVRGVSAFPSVEDPKTVVALLDDEGGEIGGMHQALERQLRRAGFRPEKRNYRPHVTLGRVRGTRNLDEVARRMTEASERRFGLTDFDRLILYMSDQTPQGTLYTELRDFPLA
ncbi:MAG: RNA 2',3'-cyclic phosphodiesterase [Planctomycetota bacterium]